MSDLIDSQSRSQQKIAHQEEVTLHPQSYKQSVQISDEDESGNLRWNSYAKNIDDAENGLEDIDDTSPEYNGDYYLTSKT